MELRRPKRHFDSSSTRIWRFVSFWIRYVKFNCHVISPEFWLEWYSVVPVVLWMLNHVKVEWPCDISKVGLLNPLLEFTRGFRALIKLIKTLQIPNFFQVQIKVPFYIRSEAVSICTGWSQDGWDRILKNGGHFHKKPPLFKFPDDETKSMAIGQGQLRSNEETVCSISWTSLVRSALTPSWI